VFFALEQIKEALTRLESVHPFFGLTYLVFKRGKLPVGTTVEFPINADDKSFLDEYYKPMEHSSYYYRVFRTSDKNKRWNDALYPYSGLQTIRTQTFGDVFIHPRGTDTWGWVPNYVDKLKFHLHRNRPIHAFSLAVWLYRERDWSSGITAEDITKTFFKEFLITDKEKGELFDVSIPKDLKQDSLFRPIKVTWEELQDVITPPPDAPQEEGGTLAYLALSGVGPAKNLEFWPSERLNLITGDNGLGKTFLLDTAWWALTGQWPELQALPRRDAKIATVTFEIAGISRRTERTTITYDWRTPEWPAQDRPAIPGFLIYARVDGSFAVWDPVRIERELSSTPRSLRFTKEQVWNGLEENIGGRARFYSNGLVRDWISWQNEPKDSPFETFKKVLTRLSPDPLQPITPGKPLRLPYPDDVRPIPTITQPYGVVPIIHAAAGIQRIVAMAYLVVWAWKEHQTLSEQQHKEPQKRMVILVDEMEAHLHPRWQRLILPALLDVSEDLATELQVQFIVATHSPLVMASAEPRFDEEKDKLFHLNLITGDLFESKVVLEEIPFARYGPVDSWLMSEVFELSETRSVEAEIAIDHAKKLQLEDNPASQEILDVSEELKRLLAVDDAFWPLWKYFAEQHGVTV
jgi:AAA domain, putative AbiEii toxin, Type IV TA system/AAA domain